MFASFAPFTETTPATQIECCEVIDAVRRKAGFLPEVQLAYEAEIKTCLLYTSPSPRDRQKARMPSSA